MVPRFFGQQGEGGHPRSPCSIKASYQGSGFCDTTGAALSHEYWVEVDLAKQGNFSPARRYTLRDNQLYTFGPRASSLDLRRPTKTVASCGLIVTDLVAWMVNRTSLLIMSLGAQLQTFRLEITRVILVPLLPSPSVVPTGLTNFAVSIAHSISTATNYISAFLTRYYKDVDQPKRVNLTTRIVANLSRGIDTIYS